MKISSQIYFWFFTVLFFSFAVWLFKDMLLPFVLGGAIAYLLNPMVEKLAYKGMGRRSAVLTILGLFFLVIGLLFAIISPILIREAVGFVEAAPEYSQKIWVMLQPHIEWAQEKLGYQVSSDQIQTVLQDNIGKALNVGKGVLGGLKTGGLAVIDFMTTLLITPIAAFFLMNEWPHVTKWVTDLIPRPYLDTVTNLTKKIDQKISGFVRGQISICMALGLVYALALTFAGLKYGFVIGLGTGVLSIIPFVGSTLGLVTSVGVAFIQSGGDLTFIGIILGIFVVGQFVEGNFITPKVMGDSVGLHPLWVIFALMAGGSVLGILGMFLAVPVAASLGVLIGFAIDQYRKSPYFLHPELEQTSHDNKTPSTSS